MPESFPSPEEYSLKEQIIECLKKYGFGASETIEVYEKWCIQREEEVTRANTSAATLEFEVEKAELFAKAGLLGEAQDILVGINELAGEELNQEVDMHEKIAEIEDYIESEQQKREEEGGGYTS